MYLVQKKFVHWNFLIQIKWHKSSWMKSSFDGERKLAEYLLFNQIIYFSLSMSDNLFTVSILVLYLYWNNKMWPNDFYCLKINLVSVQRSTSVMKERTWIIIYCRFILVDDAIMYLNEHCRLSHIVSITLLGAVNHRFYIIDKFIHVFNIL